MPFQPCNKSLLTLAHMVHTWKKLKLFNIYIEKKDFRDYSKIFRDNSLHLKARPFNKQLIETWQKRNANKLKHKAGREGSSLYLSPENG